MIVQNPLIISRSLDRSFNRNVYFVTNCIYMHNIITSMPKFRLYSIFNILPDWMPYIWGICTSAISRFCSSCAELFYDEFFRYTCFGINWPPGSVSGHLQRFFSINRGVYSVLFCSASDPPDSNLSTLNKYKLRNRSLLFKSCERSIRQGGRLGDNHKEITTCH